jgi:hypothetical protein
MKIICLVGAAVDNDDRRLLDVNIMLLVVLTEKILTMMEFV